MNTPIHNQPRGMPLVVVLVVVSLLAMLLAQNQQMLFNLGENLSIIEEQQQERLSD